MFGLSSCTHQSKIEASFTKYADRMANILDVPPASLISPALSSPDDTLPRKVDLNRKNNETISLITLARLNQCGLGPLIAERNTSLGKTQLPSTRLAWEANFLKQLNYCSGQSLDETTKAVIADMLRTKTNNWENQWSQFIQTSVPVRQSLQQNVPFIQGENDGLADTMASLKFLYSLGVYSNNESNKSRSELERHLQNLNRYKLPASAWRTKKYVGDNLTILTNWLTLHVDMETCATDYKFNEKAEYLRNVFELFFVNEIQPITGKLNSYLYNINPVIQEVIRRESIDPQFRAWVQKKMNDEDYKNSMQQHVKYWQKLFKVCEFSPGR